MDTNRDNNHTDHTKFDIASADDSYQHTNNRVENDYHVEGGNFDVCVVAETDVAYAVETAVVAAFVCAAETVDVVVVETVAVADPASDVAHRHKQRSISQQSLLMLVCT
jgi:hypothetical protein